MEDNKLIITGFYDRKKGKGSSWNFDLSPLITDFSFYKFIKENNDEEVGGFAVITNEQYIIGYNAGFGNGTHASSFARVMKDINGGGRINNATELMFLANECRQKFIVARIVFDNNQGYINFEFPNKISDNMYNSFKRFYEDYNVEIIFVSKKYNFHVHFYDSLTKKSVIDYSLNSVDNYMRSNICLNENELKKENVIGISATNHHDLRR